ncbi:hypothetical protein L596_028219 [Steinernema carpocapsae]|uniref:Uncharacterized protein n=1 Tax=Steinernema carpocapsae TaxID=34508 RepID=A0A4U5LXW5_STECR|nr:hypothetical protein L596_028219 [Steinernema carpocapsae]
MDFILQTAGKILNSTPTTEEERAYQLARRLRHISRSYGLDKEKFKELERHFTPVNTPETEAPCSSGFPFSGATMGEPGPVLRSFSTESRMSNYEYGSRYAPFRRRPSVARSKDSGTARSGSQRPRRASLPTWASKRFRWRREARTPSSYPGKPTWEPRR